ncbi:TIGR03943 family putative permease subunit [Microbacterium sp. CJ88]|uniref:TIGR03943 family putative permease subunit n=1 Tax=Microbacterium sp. CJ88 TaxID=3445672 RepID=UPI003F655C86
MGTRWLGVGLAAALAAVTLGLTLTGRLALYTNPESSWFIVGMAVVVLIGTVASFALPLGAEADHGHDHGTAADPHPDAQPVDAARHGHDRSMHSATAADHDHHPAPSRLGLAAAISGGAVASVAVLSILVLPPASLSAQLAISRDVGAPPLFAGQDVVALASTGDTSTFGIGTWAAVFATATNPDAFDGDAVTLTGFVTPGDGADVFKLTRLVITHCVIDAQPASLPVQVAGPVPATGGWVTVTGTVRSTSAGALEVSAQSVQPIDEPKDPYEY